MRTTPTARRLAFAAGDTLRLSCSRTTWSSTRRTARSSTPAQTQATSALRLHAVLFNVNGALTGIGLGGTDDNHVDDDVPDDADDVNTDHDDHDHEAALGEASASGLNADEALDVSLASLRPRLVTVAGTDTTRCPFR